MLNLSNLTSNELERYAYLAGNTQLAELSEYQSQVEDFCSIEPHLSEAQGCFVGEDWADEPLQDLHALAKRLRGDNRAELDRIIESIEEVRREAVQNAEYGRDELRKALKLVDA